MLLLSVISVGELNSAAKWIFSFVTWQSKVVSAQIYLHNLSSYFFQMYDRVLFTDQNLGYISLDGKFSPNHIDTTYISQKFLKKTFCSSTFIQAHSIQPLEVRHAIWTNPL